MKQYGINAVPFVHKDINTWRENFKGIECQHAPTGFTISGALDDVWVNKKGELIVVDYKATSKDEKIEALDKDWHLGYKRQMEIYQWLLRQNGHTVSDTGYFVYANASKDKEAFDATLEFEVTLVPYTGNADWIEKTLLDIKKCLQSDAVPNKAPDCDYCNYREVVGKALLATQPKVEKAVLARKKHPKNNVEKTTGQLF